MAEDELMALSQRIDRLERDHDDHAKTLQAISEGIHGIVAEMRRIAAQVASHTVEEADHHAKRMKRMGQILFAATSALVLLSAMYGIISGNSIPNSVLPMLKTLLGL